MTSTPSAFAEANRKAFNDLSSTYNKYPWQQMLTAQVKTALLSRLDWMNVAAWKKEPSSTDKPEVRLLDYACGSGSITAALGPYVSQTVGVDISENMVEGYNAAAKDSNLDAKAVVGNFLADDGDGVHPELKDFDLCVVSAALHHMEDAALGVKRLAERVRRGDGVVVVVDFMPFEHPHSHGKSHGHGHDHGHNHAENGGIKEGSDPQRLGFPQMAHTIKQHGFTRDDMAKMYVDAGLEDFAWEELEEKLTLGPHDGKSPQVTAFITRGTRVS